MSYPSAPEPPLPADRPDWKDSAADFIAARLELLGLEAQEATRVVVRKIIAAGVAVACLTLVWLLLLVGLIGLISAASGMPWYGVTLLAALLHLLVAGIAFLVLRRPLGAALFPLSRNEFSKDRAWLHTLRTPRRP